MEEDVGDTSFGLLSEELRKAADGDLKFGNCRAALRIFYGLVLGWRHTATPSSEERSIPSR